MRFIDKYWDSTMFKFLRRNLLTRLVRRLFYEVKMLFYVLENSLVVHFYRRIKGRSLVPITQSPLLWSVNIAQLNSVEDLRNLLKNNNFLFYEGGNTIYIPPQQKLEFLFGRMVTFYPVDAGFKILKDFRPPDKACYVGSGEFVSQGDCYIRRIMTGSIQDQVDAANVLHAFEIGPALYDVVQINTTNVEMTCFVVQHVNGVSPTLEDHSEFLAKLKTLGEEGVFSLVPPEGLNFIDFKPTDCNHNLIKQNSTGELLYVDFQQFIVRDKKKLINQLLSDAKKDFHFGDSRLLRGDKYLYQSIPGTTKIGKRDIDKRWANLRKLLKEAGIDVSKRLVLDIGCNAGMILNCALADGTLWGLGWDQPKVVEHAKRLNNLLGNTRLDFYSAKLSESYLLSKDIPRRFYPMLNQSIIFYLAVWRHFGFMSELARLPWKALVFEGHDGDTFESLRESFQKVQLEWNCTIVAKSEIRDGDCGVRPIVVLLRR